MSTYTLFYALGQSRLDASRVGIQRQDGVITGANLKDLYSALDGGHPILLFSEGLEPDKPRKWSDVKRVISTRDVRGIEVD